MCEMRIAAYCRVSTDKADQLNSLETQKAFFREYAERSGNTLVRVYADAADIIGLNQNPFTEGNDLVLIFLFLQGNEVKF